MTFGFDSTTPTPHDACGCGEASEVGLAVISPPNWTVVLRRYEQAHEVIWEVSPMTHQSAPWPFAVAPAPQGSQGSLISSKALHCSSWALMPLSSLALGSLGPRPLGPLAHRLLLHSWAHHGLLASSCAPRLSLLDAPLHSLHSLMRHFHPRLLGEPLAPFLSLLGGKLVAEPGVHWSAPPTHPREGGSTNRGA